MFFGGFKLNEVDNENFKRLENVEIDEFKYPNLHRWISYMKNINVENK